jgi:hypothetical protein
MAGGDSSWRSESTNPAPEADCAPEGLTWRMWCCVRRASVSRCSGLDPGGRAETALQGEWTTEMAMSKQNLGSGGVPVSPPGFRSPESIQACGAGPCTPSPVLRTLARAQSWMGRRPSWPLGQQEEWLSQKEHVYWKAAFAQEARWLCLWHS